MYALSILSPANAMDFEPLAPFEVRPVLYELAALPRVVAVGATLMGRPVGLAIAVRGWAEPGAFGGAAPSAQSARLLCVTVARNYRRIGIGRALLDAIEQSLIDAGVDSLACNYALASPDGRTAFERLLTNASWSAPELTMLQCRADRPILESPMMREQLVLPPEYSITDWVDLTERDREFIRERQAHTEWYPPTLDPFHFEPDLEISNSLALRFHGEVVGWLITRRTSATTMYYRCLFVRADLARLGRGLALICEAITRHSDLIGSKPGFGEWSTPASLPAMIRFIRRHLAPYGTTVIEQRAMRKQLRPASAPIATARTPRRELVRARALTNAECDHAIAAVRALRAEWIPRLDPFAFHSLGAVARFDAFEDAAHYTRTAARTNALLTTHFGALYERVSSALAAALGATVAPRAGCALPAIHILDATRGAHLPLAPIHCDVAHQYVDAGGVYAARPVSFVMCLSVPDAGAGLTTWELGADETVGLDTEETARLLESVPKSQHLFERGELMILGSGQFHQLTPLADAAPGTHRIFVEGQAVFESGSWWMFG